MSTASSKPTPSKSSAKNSTPSFDRIKPAPAANPISAPVVDARDDDVQGKRALFSGAEQPPSVGSVAMECNRCTRRSVVSFVRLAKLCATGVYLPVPGGSHKAWLKCPACKHHAWLTISRS